MLQNSVLMASASTHHGRVCVLCVSYVCPVRLSLSLSLRLSLRRSVCLCLCCVVDDGDYLRHEHMKAAAEAKGALHLLAAILSALLPASPIPLPQTLMTVQQFKL